MEESLWANISVVKRAELRKRIRFVVIYWPRSQPWQWMAADLAPDCVDVHVDKMRQEALEAFCSWLPSSSVEKIAVWETRRRTTVEEMNLFCDAIRRTPTIRLIVLSLSKEKSSFLNKIFAMEQLVHVTLSVERLDPESIQELPLLMSKMKHLKWLSMTFSNRLSESAATVLQEAVQRNTSLKRCTFNAHENGRYTYDPLVASLGQHGQWFGQRNTNLRCMKLLLTKVVPDALWPMVMSHIGQEGMLADPLYFAIRENIQLIQGRR
eukprot:CAMPEP_0116540728 /NCGR_PEP_ID=MMETSP0397-20121206/104_1 /TAXON_ID=216820 /ORGANISM="Cyclophora tenuis, Strain ECT3854" /LENGTH=265 /DNA_ID=CAMNT_0004064623 /DNA_START=99 /DNA_END=896 /DNA_ORIENTATION=-